MDDSDREPFQQRWDRLRRHLDEAKRDRTSAIRFGLASFIIATTATGAVVGSIGRSWSPATLAVLVLVTMMVLCIAVTLSGLVLYLRYIDRKAGRRSRRTTCARRIAPASSHVTPEVPEPVASDQTPLSGD